jgi:hypothetical protein
MEKKMNDWNWKSFMEWLLLVLAFLVLVTGIAGNKEKAEDQKETL